jgi:hypothetical protein
MNDGRRILRFIVNIALVMFGIQPSSRNSLSSSLCWTGSVLDVINEFFPGVDILGGYLVLDQKKTKTKTNPPRWTRLSLAIRIGKGFQDDSKSCHNCETFRRYLSLMQYTLHSP